MQENDFLLDEQPELAMEQILLDVRNRQAHNELSSFNNTGKFINKHPLVVKKTHYKDSFTELVELKRTDPKTFLKQVTNVTQNIRRIKSQLEKKKYKSEAEKQSWQTNLEKAQIRKQVIEEIL